MVGNGAQCNNTGKKMLILSLSGDVFEEKMFWRWELMHEPNKWLEVFTDGKIRYC